MTVSTDAYLFYGFTFYDAEEGIGEPPPWERREGDSSNPRWTDWNRYCDAATVAKLKELKIQIDSHCHSDYPCYFICPEETWKFASRGYPKVIENLDVPEDADARLRTACELLGIEFKQPKWIMASYWG